MPSISQDIDTLIRNTEFFFRYLPIKNIYVIGPESIAEKVSNAHNSRLIFMNENEFVDVPRIRELYSSRTDKNTGRAGWYVQQYIKMQFARFTKDEYYLIWDSDTIPLKPVELFDEASGKRLSAAVLSCARHTPVIWIHSAKSSQISIIQFRTPHLSVNI